MNFQTLDHIDVSGKRVLLRVDLNVPVHDGKISDLTRLERITPTIIELADRGAKVILVSHFDRPKGKRVESMSLRPVSNALRDVRKTTILTWLSALPPWRIFMSMTRSPPRTAPMPAPRGWRAICRATLAG